MIYSKVRARTAVDIRRRKFESKAVPEDTLHRCTVCKRTEKDSPELEFRVSRNGEEYCLEHLPKVMAEPGNQESEYRSRESEDSATFSLFRMGKIQAEKKR